MNSRIKNQKQELYHCFNPLTDETKKLWSIKYS